MNFKHFIFFMRHLKFLCIQFFFWWFTLSETQLCHHIDCDMYTAVGDTLRCVFIIKKIENRFHQGTRTKRGK